VKQVFMPPLDNPFEAARQLYKPDKVKLLFITEMPQPAELHRYFYFEQVRSHDSLFLELMKVLFPEEVAAFETVKALRAEKRYFLERFRDAGFYFTNGFDVPHPNTSQATRRKALEGNLPQLIKQVQAFISPETPVVLISSVAYQALNAPLREAGFNVLNERLLEYPNSGQQINFRKNLTRLLQQYNLMPDPV
jgi:hypothetical protein